MSGVPILVRPFDPPPPPGHLGTSFGSGSTVELKPNLRRMPSSHALRRAAVVPVRGAALIAAVTAVCYRARLNSASAALPFLIAVVL